MYSPKKCFGARIKEIREARGINQEQLAELINMESRHLSRIETGKSFTTMENIVKIADALKVEVNTLFEFKHKQDKSIWIKEINKFIKNADDEKIEIVYKFVNAIMR